MLRFFSFAVLYLFIKSAQTCPDSEYVEPCECFSTAKIIRCNYLDKDITFPDISQFTDTYNSFVIHGYKGEILDLKDLEKIKFQRLFIENSTLTHITSSSKVKFSKVTNSLVIRNNENLVFDEKLRDTIGLFDEIVSLSVENNTSILKFEFVPTPTFANLNQVILRNNKIEKFAFDSIKLIKTLQQINLDHNAISEVKIDLTSFDGKLVINVNYNSVINVEIVKTDGDKQSTVSIYLENNKLTRLEQNKVFYFVKQPNNHLYLRDNEFQCTCDYTTTTWIVSFDLQSTIHDMRCATHSNRNIFEVGFINCTDILSTTPKEAVISAEPTTAPEEPATQIEIEPTTAPDEPATLKVIEPTTAPDEPATLKVIEPTTAPNEPATQKKIEPTTAPNEPEPQTVVEPKTVAPPG